MTNASRNQSNGGKIGIVLVMVLVGLSVIGFMGFKAYGYYQDRYVGEEFYGKVPSDAVIEVETIYDNQGTPQDSGHEYSITGYNEAGETRQLDFTVYSDTVDGLYPAGTYVKAEASKQLVVNQQVVSRDEVPAAVLEYLD